MSFLADRSGAVAVIFALLVVPLAAMAGGFTVDYFSLERDREILQAAADQSAMVGLRASLVDGEASAQQAAQAVIGNTLPETFGNYDWRYSYSEGDKTGEVVIEGLLRTHFAALVGVPYLGATVRAVASYQTPVPLCLLALGTGPDDGIHFTGSGLFHGPDCAVWSNSPESDSLRYQGAVSADAFLFCAVGGHQRGPAATVSPLPTNRCDPVADPLEQEHIPEPGVCTSTGSAFSDAGTLVLHPGTYCGGFSVSASAVEMRPGIYHLVGGAVTIRSSTRIVGEAVTIVLSDDATLDVAGSGDIAVSAPATGPTAGYVLMGSRSQSGAPSSRITGNSGLTIDGSIYLPSQAIEITGNSSLTSERSDVSIIARSITLGGSAEVFLVKEREMLIDAYMAEFSNLFLVE